MARFRDVALIVPSDVGRETRRSTVRVARAIRNELSDTRIDAPWVKLVVHVGEFGSDGAGAEAVFGVLTAYVRGDVRRLESETEAEVRRQAGEWILRAVEEVTKSGLWTSDEFRAIVRDVASHEGPYTHEPAALQTRDRRTKRAYRTRYVLGDDGLVVLLLCVDPAGNELARAEVFRIDGGWDPFFDFDPNRIRLTDHTVEYIGRAKQIIKSIPRSFCD